MKVPGIAYGVLCGILWVIPLLQILHAESSAVIAGASFFIAGLAALHAFKKGEGLLRVLIQQWVVLLVPLAMMTLSMVWQPNCGYGLGLLFFLLFPGISVFFAVSLAWLVHTFPLLKKRLWLILAGLGICIAGPVFDIGFHSQFFTYNHVFGGVMGPIYDEEVSIRSGLLAFRALTVLWGLLFIVAGLSLDASKRRLPFLRIARVAIVLGIGCMYLFSARLRINSPEWFIQEKLGGHLATPHFDIYYAPEATTSYELYKYANDHEYRYHTLSQLLNVEVGQRIRSYIHPDPETKEFLTGARLTNVAPVWLRTPQIHIYADVFDQVFAHELIHVFSREFGLPVLNASVSVGLVEGLAVALEPSEGRPLPHDQVLTAAVIQRQALGATELQIGERIEGSLSPFGFWTGRGAVSYTTMGSFVQYLIATYGYERIKQVYAFSNFEHVYGKSARELAMEWETYLNELPSVSRATSDYVTRRFSVPSIFERRCPHYIPEAVLSHRKGMEALARADTAAALAAIDAALQKEPLYQPAVDIWSRIQLSQQRADSVIARIPRLYLHGEEAYITPVLWLHLGDAYTVSDDTQRAIAAYDSARAALPLFSHREIGFLELRKLLAHRPDLLSIVLAPLSIEEKLERLDELPDNGSLRLFIKGLLLMAGEDIEGAIRHLEQIDMEVLTGDHARLPDLHRYYAMTLVDLYYLADQPENAWNGAMALKSEFEALGAEPEALLYTDIADKIRYIMESE